MTAGIESIIGARGQNEWREILGQFDDYVLKRILQKNPTTRAEQITDMYQKIAIRYLNY